MAMTMHVDIVSAEVEIYSGTVTEVYAPAEMGEVGIMAHHAPLITKMKPGEVRVVTDGGATESFFVSGGILEVYLNITLYILDYTSVPIRVSINSDVLSIDHFNSLYESLIVLKVEISWC